MLQLFPDHLRVEIEPGAELHEIPETLRTALHLCQLNELGGVLVVSAANGLDLRAGIRASLRTMLAKRLMPPLLRLGLVGLTADAISGLQGVKALADAELVACEVFADEVAARAWLRAR
jgi:hypothetical protein